MYAGVTILDMATDKMDEAEALYRDFVVPMFNGLEGARGLMLLVDRSTGKSISIGLWDNEEAAKEYETSGMFGETVGRFGEMFKGAPVRGVYEVAVQSMK